LGHSLLTFRLRPDGISLPIMAKWRNEKAFVSWMGLSPNNKVSGEQVLSSRTRKVNNRAATTLRLAAMLLGRTDTPLGSFYRRKRAHLGAPKAITATARKLGCLIYRLIKDGQAYQEPDLHTYELKYKNQLLRSLRRRAKGTIPIPDGWLVAYGTGIERDFQDNVRIVLGFSRERDRTRGRGSQITWSR
jgi:hypothetical protein